MKKTIDAIHTSGEPVMMKRYSEYPPPGLEIDAVPITLPLQRAQTSAIQHTYGPFERSSTDRALWQLDPFRYTISNPAWDKIIKTAVQDVSDCLGTAVVNTTLHSLILQGQSSYTEMYDDSKILPGDAMTLMVCLPTDCKGGEMQFTYDGRSWAFNASQNPYDISIIAWFSDVAHKIKPITQGERLTLVYKLLLAEDSVNSARSAIQQTQNLNHAMAELRTLDSSGGNNIYLLEHTYPKDCLDEAHLRGRDRYVCQALREACSRNGYDVFLGNITKDCFHYGEWHQSHPECDDYSPLRKSSFNCEIIEVLGQDVYSSRTPDTNCRNDGYVRYEYHDSAIVMVPKEILWRWLPEKIDIDAIENYIEVEITSRLRDSWTIKGACLFFAGVRQDSFRLQLRAVKLAWESKDEELFQEIVGKCFFFNKKSQTAVIQCLMDTFHEIVSKGEEGCEITSALVDIASGHARLIGFIDSLNSVYNAYDSLSHNNQTAIEISVDDPDFTDTDDFSSQDADEIMNVLVPKLIRCGSQPWLSKFIVFLFQKSHGQWYEEPERQMLNLLEKLKQKLAAVRNEAGASGLDDVGPPRHALFFERFSKSLLSKLNEAIHKLYEVDFRNWTQENSNKLLLYICKELQQSTTAPSGAMKNFIIARLRDNNTSVFPKKLGNYANSIVKCNRRTCQADDELKKFVVSPFASQVRLTLEGKDFERMNLQLPERSLGIKVKSFFHTNPVEGTRRHMFELEFVKLNSEYTFDMDEFKIGLGKLVKTMQVFRSEYLQKHLGDKLYDELITFDTLLKSQDGLAGHNVSAGQKRKAEESMDHSAAKK
ncbi:hypothetical protein F5Y18DRAFT_439707 [Xylariaceae sp. FL1019]|nr:hypothetical protein F5Y18DRAFT_439707 [Xylariaceae sp. FL1019]